MKLRLYVENVTDITTRNPERKEHNSAAKKAK
jgi:hypothetical protein